MESVAKDSPPYGSYSLVTDGERGDRRITTTRALVFESFRLQTFYYFKYKKQINVANLARRGYFYDRLTDDVKCFFCPSKLSHKNNYIEPPLHGRNDECKMVHFPLNGNVPIIEENSDIEDSISKLSSLLQESMSINVQAAVPNEKTVIDFDERLAFNELEFVFSGGIDNKDFSNYEVRLSTFDPWFSYLPESERPFKERFAKAGFVYTGVSDIVMCFKCKGGLFNIDRHDDPKDDHVKIYGFCRFIMEIFPSNIRFPSNTGLSTRFMSDEQTLLVMSHPMIKNLILHGYDEDTINKWIIDYMDIYCCFPKDIKSCRKELTKWIEESKKK